MTAQPGLFDDDDAEPVLPYPGPSSGWSGTDTSHARAEHRDSTGMTGKLQARLWDMLTDAGPRGLTIAEVRDVCRDEHHGSLSGALSNLHKGSPKTGRRIAMLEQKRARCHVYVHLSEIRGRPTVPRKS